MELRRRHWSTTSVQRLEKAKTKLLMTEVAKVAIVETDKREATTKRKHALEMLNQTRLQLLRNFHLTTTARKR